MPVPMPMPMPVSINGIYWMFFVLPYLLFTVYGEGGW